MKIFLKCIVGLIVIVLLANGARALYTYWEKSQDPNREPDVLDHVTGKSSVDKFLQIKKKKDNFNLSALRTQMAMFYTQHGRYPKSMQELEQAENVSPDLTHDQYGNYFQLQFNQQNKPVLQSAGPDEIHGTTDDVQYPL